MGPDHVLLPRPTLPPTSAPAPHVALGILSGVTGGPATYGIRLAGALAKLPDALRFTVVTDVARAFEGLGCDVVEVPMRGGLDRLRWQHLALPRALRRLGCTLYHDTKNALPLGCRVPSVVTVHDLAYHRTPETFGWASRLFLKRATAHAVRNARLVVVPSRATAVDVEDIHPETRGRVRVVPHGIDPLPAADAARCAEVRQRLGLPERYVLHVGTVQSRKNVDMLVRALRRLRRERGVPHRLVVAGRRGWQSDAAFAEIDADDTALYLGEVAGADLPALYRSAEVFASPSAYEGFGLAVADALSAGVATVVAPAGSLPEVVGDAAVVMARLDEDALVDALAPLLLDDAERAALAGRGPGRAAEFTWERAARATAAVWSEVRGGGENPRRPA